MEPGSTIEVEKAGVGGPNDGESEVDIKNHRADEGQEAPGGRRRSQGRRGGDEPSSEGSLPDEPDVLPDVPDAPPPPEESKE